MALSVQDIIDQGYSKSAAARVQSIAAPQELVTEVGNLLREIFLTLARENPEILGAIATLNFDGTGWPRAADCLRAIKLQATAGTIVNPALAVGAEITVVPFNDQAFCKGDACVTEFGQRYIPTGQTMDPSDGSISQLYARAPIIPTQTTDPIDPLFPEFFSDVLACGIAAYLADKDERTEDKTTFLGLKAAGAQQIVQWSRGQTYSVQQRFPLVVAPLTNTDGGRQSPADQ